MKRSRAMLVPLVWALAACGGPGDPTDKPGKTPPDTGTRDTGTAPGPGQAVSVVEGGTVLCDNPARRLSTPYDRVVADSEPARPNLFWGVGVVVADLNGDNFLDIVLPGYLQTQLFWGTAQGVMVPDHTKFDGLPVNLSSGGSAVDYDGDGDLDLFFTRFLLPNVLLRNDNTGFTDVTAEAGLSDEGRRSISSSWGDYDGDGDLDLFVGTYGFIDESNPDLPHADFEGGDRSWLYVNNGDGTFTDRSDTLPPQVHEGYGFVGAWIDLDRDSLPELYIVNDFGERQPNVLLWNRGGGVLEMDNNAVGLSTPMTGMGLDVFDSNEDGIADLVMPEWNGLWLRESTSLGFWVESGNAYGLYNDVSIGQKVGWGVQVGDYDNDADLDIAITFGDLDSNTYDAPDFQPDGMFLQGAQKQFTDSAGLWQMNDLGDNRGLVAADLNNDGYLDLVKRDTSGPTVIYRSSCGDQSWLRVRLHDVAPNTYAIGATVRVFYGDERRQMGWIRAGGMSHASGGPPEAHFGLGEAETVRRVQITWPDGAVSNLFDVSTKQILDVTRQ